MGRAESSVLFIAVSSALWDEAHFVHSRDLVLCFHWAAFWKEWLKIHPATLSYTSQGRLFHCTFTAFVCWLDGLNGWLQALSCRVLFMSCCFLLNFILFLGSQEGQSTTCCLTLEGGLTTICSWRVKIDFESWTDYQQNGGVLFLESTGNL